jgi:rhomboid family protein
MLPLHDLNPSEGKPVVVWLIITSCVMAFLYELSLDTGLMSFVEDYGFVSARATAALRGETGLLSGLIVPALTSTFLHGGWLHLIGNMWFLWIFGDNVEDRIGHILFILFYLFCGVAACLVQYAFAPQSNIPMVGASGAIAGVLGAYAVTWPRARVLTLVPVFIFVMFFRIPALFVLGFWFVWQVLNGADMVGAAQQGGGGVAYGAHIGGFIVGAVIFICLPRRAAPAARRLNGRGGYGRGGYGGR